MKIDFMDALKNVVESNNVKLTILSEDTQEESDFDMGLHRILDLDESKRKGLEWMRENGREETVYYVPDYFATEYCVAKIPQAAREYGDVLIIGPYLNEYIDEIGVQKMMNEASIPLEYRTELEEYFRAVPFIKNCEQWRELCNRFLGMLYGTQTLHVEYLEFLYDDMEFDKNMSEESLAYELIEERYAGEKELMLAISEGNIDESLRIFAQMRRYRMEKRYESPVRELRNGSITLNTLLRKAVEHGGVHPVHIDRLSSQMAKKIETISSQKDYQNIITEMIRKYCLLVQNYSMRGYSPVIQKVANHINLNLSQDLSLKTLAKQYSVSASYLSTLFKKEIGLNITDYVNQQRIRRAIILLNTTNMQIQDIAGECGIYDTSYFRKLFKKYIGKTPTEYLKQIR